VSQTTPDAAPAGSSTDSADQKMVANLNTRINDTRLGTNVSGVVLDAASDQVIWGHDASTALMPASNAKLATATVALTVLGPNHRFTTRVVYGHGPGRDTDARCLPGDRPGPALLPAGRGDLRGEHPAAGQPARLSRGHRGPGRPDTPPAPPQRPDTRR
jgi:hypothetical protein